MTPYVPLATGLHKVALLLPAEIVYPLLTDLMKYDRLLIHVLQVQLSHKLWLRKTNVHMERSLTTYPPLRFSYTASMGLLGH